MDYITAIEKALGKKAKLELMVLQSSEMLNSYADVNDLIKAFDNRPATAVEESVASFVQWYGDISILQSNNVAVRVVQAKIYEC